MVLGEQIKKIREAILSGDIEAVRRMAKDLTITNKYGYRPYTAARVHGYGKTAEYIKTIEPTVTEAEQDALFARYHVPAKMRDYFKTGPLMPEFPEGEQLRWVRLFAYTDVAEINYRGQRLLSLVEDSEDFEVMLLWEFD